MSRSEDEERTPLVYEDRVRSSSGISDTDASRRRRRYLCVGLTTVCLGVGLVLAVALPLTMSKDKTATNPVNPMMLNEKFPDESTATEETSEVNTGQTTTTETHSSSSSSHSTSLFPPIVPSSKTPSSTFPTTSPPDPFAVCPSVPMGRRTSINLDQLNGRILFELYRVQTPKAPTSAADVSCSTVQFDFQNLTNGTGSVDGTMKLKWIERGYIRRYPRQLEVKLEGNSESPYDWTETVGNSSDEKGRLSLLAQIDGYLLAYECFPNVSIYPGFAYAIHVYSVLPWRSSTLMAMALLNLADTWGLNPASERTIYINHRYCPAVGDPPNG